MPKGSLWVSSVRGTSGLFVLVESGGEVLDVSLLAVIISSLSLNFYKQSETIFCFRLCLLSAGQISLRPEGQNILAASLKQDRVGQNI